MKCKVIYSKLYLSYKYSVSNVYRKLLRFFYCEARLSMTDRSITFKQKYQQLSTYKAAKESVYFTVSAHISTVCCLALLWAVHSVLTWWVLPCLWSPSSTVNKSWGLHRWRNTLLLYTRTRPYFLLYLLNFPSISHISHCIFKTMLLTNSIFTGEFFSYTQ